MKDLSPLSLYRLPPGEYDQVTIDAIGADYILLRGVYQFLPFSIVLEHVRLATPAQNCERASLPVRLKATEQGSPAIATEIEFFASRLAAPLDYGIAVHIDDYRFIVRRGGEKPLVDRLAGDRHGKSLLELVAPYYAPSCALSKA
jgi:hypothetical protein